MSDRDPEQTKRAATPRMEAFVEAVPERLKEEVMKLPRQLELMNAKAVAKIRRIHVAADGVYAAAAGRVACKRGCAHCCHVAVVISAAEAAYVGDRIGRAPADIRESRLPDVKGFSGTTPCTFLRENRCTIYEHRPLACREALNFDEDEYWCRPENWSKPGAIVPKPTVAGLRDAYRVASAAKSGTVVADIREWFPAPGRAKDER
jgi:Fe-S-cluster containining protein